MNPKTLVAITVATLVLSACNTLSNRSTGSVANVTATELRLCFPEKAMPAPGQEVRIVRSVAIAGTKPPMNQDRSVGTARITSAADNGCATAALITGQARNGDHASWSISDVPR